MIFYAISRLEKGFSFFNRHALSADDLLNWASILGIKTVPDTSVRRAFTGFIRKHPLIIYNPHLPPDDLILTLGHELGHHLLGHIEHADLFFSEASLFCRNGIEKDAGIVGFLCWLPTKKLQELDVQDRLDAQELAWELKNCDSEWDFLLKVCHARIRIYEGYKILTFDSRLRKCSRLWQEATPREVVSRKVVR